MTVTALDSPAIYHQRRVAFAALSGAIVLLLAILACGELLGLRVNTTPSEPLGLWRIRPLATSSVRVGMTVFVCPPDNDTMREGLRRGYLRNGTCSGGFGPLIKTIVALSGQRIDVSDHLSVDGVEIAASRLVELDGHGRPLRPDTGGIVPPGSIYLHSNFAGSWDSRYFGPVPQSGILGLAQEVLTYAP